MPFSHSDFFNIKPSLFLESSSCPEYLAPWVSNPVFCTNREFISRDSDSRFSIKSSELSSCIPAKKEEKPQPAIALPPPLSLSLASAMATSSGDHSASLAVSDETDHTLQPFFVLHKAQPPVNQEKSSRSGRGAGRRKTAAGSSPKSPQKLKQILSEIQDPLSDSFLEQLRLDAFDKTWSKIHSTIQGVLRDINLKLFDEVLQWIEESFESIKSKPNSNEIQKPYPLICDTLCTKIPTSFVLTKNAEYVDDIQTFKDLGSHLKENNCHVANISALDFSTKCGIGGCIKSLLRQLHSESIDVADMMVLAKWYCEENNFNKPIIVMIDDLERCNGSILGYFITMLSEWVNKIPIYFIMGIATTIEAPKKILSSDSLQHLMPCKFNSKSPFDKMDLLIESVLVKCNIYFAISHNLAGFLRNYFLKHDGTVTSFITALKLACCKHFSLEPLSFLSLSIVDEDKEFWCEKFDSLPESLKTRAFDLPSCKSAKNLQKNGSTIIQCLSDLKAFQKDWSSVTLCLFEVARNGKIQLLDIFCEALEPEMNNGIKKCLENNLVNGDKYVREDSGRVIGSIAQAVHLLREMSVVSLSKILAKWDIHTKGMDEINEKVKELQSLLSSPNEGQIYTENLPNIRRRGFSLGATKQNSLNDKVAMLLNTMLRKYMVPIESIPFHEIICFKNVNILQSALIGDPRRTIQLDLFKSSNGNSNSLSSSMHDTSIMYNLAQEYGDVINLHDWFQSFKTIITNNSSQNNSKKKKTNISSPSKRQKSNISPSETEALIQARFCRAVMELQITGLLRMPSKRRPDFVQRIAFGF